jgi:hypothetical protein
MPLATVGRVELVGFLSLLQKDEKLKGQHKRRATKVSHEIQVWVLLMRELFSICHEAEENHLSKEKELKETHLQKSR